MNPAARPAPRKTPCRFCNGQGGRCSCGGGAACRTAACSCVEGALGIPVKLCDTCTNHRWLPCAYCDGRGHHLAGRR